MASSSDAEPDAAERNLPDTDEEGLLWADFKRRGSSAARERLFSRFVGFARNVARRLHREHSWGDLELADLQQHAYTGLLEALDRYDPDLGTPFRAFASYRISGSIRDGIARTNEMREQISWRRRVRRERVKSLSAPEAETTSVPAAPIEKLAEIAAGLALGFMLEGTTLFVEDDAEGGQPIHAAATAYDSVVWNETVSRLHEELASLPEREQNILRQHYIGGLSFDQLASLLSISKGRVSQLHRAALESLRKRLRERGYFRITR
jgi:RNA polymerase sigma factor for flagellar operon FliA